MKNKRLFTDKKSGHGTVVLNWQGTPEHEFSYFAKAFHLTAKESVNALRQTENFGLYGHPMHDFRAYPIVFLYRHALELYMKATIMVYKSPLETHSLKDLLKAFECVFKANDWDWDLGVPRFKTLEDFRTVIEEFNEIDGKADVFRYPIKKKTGKASLESTLQFNLFEFCDVLDELLNALDGVVICAKEEFREKLELMAEENNYELENSEDYHE